MIRVLSFPEKKGKTITQKISATTAILLLIIGLTATTAPYASATTEPASEEEGLEQYVNETYGYAFSYPSGWVFEDYVQTYGAQLFNEAERQLGYGFLGFLCPEDVAIPALGGGHSCEAALSTESEGLDLLGFIRFENLDGEIATRLGLTEQEWRQEAPSGVVTDDVFAWYAATVLGKDDPESAIDDSQQVQEIVSETPITIPVVGAQSGQTIRQAEGALMEFVYGSNLFSLAPVYRSYQVFAVYGDTGFIFGMEGQEDEVDSGEVPEVLQTVIDSFRFVE